MLKQLLSIALLSASLSSFAEARAGRSFSSGLRSVLVHGYVRSNGTYVAPYLRSPPISRGGVGTRTLRTLSVLGPAAVAAGAASAMQANSSPLIVEIGSARPPIEPDVSAPAVIPTQGSDHGLGGVTIGMDDEEIRRHADKVCGYGNGTFISCGDIDSELLDGFEVGLSKGPRQVASMVVHGFCSNEPITAVVEKTRLEMNAVGYAQTSKGQILFRLPDNFKGLMSADGFCFDKGDKIVATHYNAIISDERLRVQDKAPSGS